MAGNNKPTRFTNQEKNALRTGQEITDGEIVWRKLSDGSGVWRYDFTVNGHRYKGTLGREKHGVTLSQARSEYQRIYAQATLEAPIVKTRTSGSPLGNERFETAAQSFLKWSEAHHSDYTHNKSRMEKHLLPRFSERTLGSITAGDVEDLRVAVLEAELSRSTVKCIVSLMSNVFEYARQSDPSIQNPTRGLRKLRPEPKKIEVFTDEQIQRLLDPKINEAARVEAPISTGHLGRS